MQALLTIILATVVIAIRRTTRPPHTYASLPAPRPMRPLSTPAFHHAWHRRGSVRLLGRAVTGMVIALAIIGFSALPWPATAGVWSAAMAADIASFQVEIWQHRDLVLMGSVLFWILLPLWGSGMRRCLREGRALVRINYLLPIWIYHQGRYVLARAAVGYQFRLRVQPLWGRMTVWGHHGWWLIRFGVWSIRRTLGWCYTRGAR